MKRRLVYVLCDPVTDEIRYVGQSSVGPRRAKYHLWHAKALIRVGKRAPQHVYGWLINLLKSGHEPEVVIVEDDIQDDQALDESERFFISYFRMIGCRLTNMTDGGGHTTRGIKYPQSYRDEKSRVMKEKLQRPEELVKFEKFQAAGQTPEANAKRSESMKRWWAGRRR